MNTSQSRKAIDPSTVLLRPLTVADVSDRYVDWLNDEEVNQFLEVRHYVPLSKQMVLDFVRECERARRYHWGIFDNGIHVGNISCSISNSLYRWIDISNVIGEAEYRGTNLAKFSLAAAMSYLFSRGYHRISAGTYSNHLSGITLLTNLGFKKEGVLRDWALHKGRYVDMLKFGILEDEWELIAPRYPKIEVESPLWDRHGN